jgi:RNA polymerase sigma-70 factor (ECF subfamily)
MVDHSADHDLMARVARGDEQAFRALVRRHAAAAHRVARRIVQRDALAEEIVQDAFLRVWINAARWRPQAAFRTWLYRIVVNLCLNAKRRPVDLPLAAGGDPAASDDAGAALEREERDRALAAAVDALPARQRAAIVLTYQEGLSNAEAAAVLDASVSGLEALLVRARRALRVALGDDDLV